MPEATVDAPPAAPSPSPLAGIDSWMSRLHDTPTNQPKEKPNASPPATTTTTPPAVPVGTAPVGDGNVDGGTPPAKPAIPAKPEDATAPPAEPQVNVPRNRKEWDSAKEAIRVPLQAEIAKWKTKATELEGEVTRVKETASRGLTETDKAEMDRLKKENEDYSTRLQLLDVTQHPKFQSHFDNRVSAQLELAKRIVGPEQADAVVKALKLPNTEEFVEIKNARLQELLDTMSPIQQSRIGSIINELEQIDATKDGEIKRLSEHREKLRVEREDAQKNAKAAQEQLFDKTVKAFQDPDKGFDTYKLRDGDEAWNKDVRGRIAQAKEMIFDNKATPEQVINAVLHVNSLPLIVSEAKKLYDENIQLKSQIAKLTKAQPSLPNGGGADGGGNGDSTPPIKPGTPPRTAVENYVGRVMKAGG